MAPSPPVDPPLQQYVVILCHTGSTSSRRDDPAIPTVKRRHRRTHETTNVRSRALAQNSSTVSMLRKP